MTTEKPSLLQKHWLQIEALLLGVSVTCVSISDLSAGLLISINYHDPIVSNGGQVISQRDLGASVRISIDFVCDRVSEWMCECVYLLNRDRESEWLSLS